MGTRGAFGFRFRDADKLTYNHYDSYPTGLGAEIMRAIQKYNDEQLAGAANRLKIAAGKPTEEDKAFYRDVADLGVSERSLDDWYCLLRSFQGDLGALIEGRCNHIDGGNDFMADSLFCEWAYVINMDTRELEIYVGFNRAPGGAGRYAELGPDRGYYGVRLISTLSLDDVRKITDIEAACELIEAQAEEKEDA